MEYKDTLNLPQTKFPMKAGLPQKEPEMLKNWQDTDIYSQIRKLRKGAKKYILHDGPPYSNGDIHIGHTLNKTIKDIIIKYKTMQGFDCAYVPGWDCHGLPVEHQLFKTLKISKHDIDKVTFRKKAHDYAMGFVDVQRNQFKRLGIFADWDRPYLTLDKVYEEAIIRSFASMTAKGYIYKGLKPVNWCYSCETALAEAEVEYEDHTSPSVFAKFKIKDNSYIVIWTTTPWTLIANVAVAVNPDFDYAIIETSQGQLIMAKALSEGVLQRTGIKDYKIIKTVKGKELEGTIYQHPFGLREGKVVLADYVSLEDGTGCVHTAPGHGEDDYLTGQRYKLETVMPVDEKGRFTEEAGEFKGQNVHKANAAIIEKLKSVNALLLEEDIAHSYPHCWRCKNPVISRATEQWFVAIDKHNLRKNVLNEINKNIQWIPREGKERISSMVENRPDWCLSRQRYWGVPIPVFKCDSCNTWICDAKLINYFADIVSKEGSDAWFIKTAAELIPAGYECPKCKGKTFIKGEDILDVWFESGVSHQGVLKKRAELDYPCEIYVEGSDQHRGWFQSSLITGVAIDNKSPYKSVLTHGFVVDGEGRKMSKSLGNVISPQDVSKVYGADILRLWVASCDYSEDVRLSDEILARLVESYRKIRNTARYILGNLYDFSPEKDVVEYKNLLPVDKWALAKAHELLKECQESYDCFNFHKAYRAIYNFCVLSMSNFYLDILKDRLYTFGQNSQSRRSAQSAIYEILNILTATTAPLLAFTAEEIYSYTPKRKDAPESVHLCPWPKTDEAKIDNELLDQWQRLSDIRQLALKVLEEKRTSGIIGNSLEAAVSIYTASGDDYDFLKKFEGQLTSIFIVSQVSVCKAKEHQKMLITATKAQGAKCARCWNWSAAVGENKKHPSICKRCAEVVE